MVTSLAPCAAGYTKVGYTIIQAILQDFATYIGYCSLGQLIHY